MKTGHYYLTATQAAEALGVTRATLYAYTSRGQLRSEPVSGRPRERRYYREDVERLKERKEARRDPTRAAARGLHWGGPVLESGITLIHNGRFYYRGHDAVKLAETASAGTSGGAVVGGGSRRRRAAVRATLHADASPIGAAAHLRQGAAHAASGRLADRRGRATWRPTTLRPAAVRQTGARIMRLLTTIVAQHRRARSPFTGCCKRRGRRRETRSAT